MDEGGRRELVVGGLVVVACDGAWGATAAATSYLSSVQHGHARCWSRSHITNIITCIIIGIKFDKLFLIEQIFNDNLTDPQSNVEKSNNVKLPKRRVIGMYNASPIQPSNGRPFTRRTTLYHTPSP
jgi:hypothetical protein